MFVTIISALISFPSTLCDRICTFVAGYIFISSPSVMATFTVASGGQLASLVNKSLTVMFYSFLLIYVLFYFCVFD